MMREEHNNVNDHPSNWIREEREREEGELTMKLIHHLTKIKKHM
mgnify:CR=1 FL=1